ncbi:glutathione S-transferase theta-1-like [Phlebotomus argentipes]|uniref:glutathione S-transferase theta-1-like n=1 Tax=Phlebotomus argentipes TaxID=94469 RepID=UPI002892F7C8|nr:glutathione S-transferase theta-1-like [Phlebotomus argentipes]
MSSNLKFYSNLMSQPCRSLYIVMNLAKIPFETVTIALREGDHATESFAREVNNLKTIPSINDAGFKLGESIAILRYLATKSSLIVRWYPTGARMRARVDEYLEWHHLNVRAPCSGYFVESWLKPRQTKQPPNDQVLEKRHSQVNKTLDCLENVWLAEGDFLVGTDVSAADIWAICELEQLTLIPFDPTEGRPKLRAWMQRVRKATNPFYDDAHETLWNIRKKSMQNAQRSPKL